MYYLQQDIHLYVYVEYQIVGLIVRVHLGAEFLNENGRITSIDIEKRIKDELDGVSIDDFLMNPTYEGIAQYICDITPSCYKVSLQTKDGRTYVYSKK